MRLHATWPLLLAAACGTASPDVGGNADASSSDASTTPDAAPPPPEAAPPVDAKAADAGCEIAMGAPILASVVDGTSWEVSIDAHHGVAVAAWISYEGTHLAIRAAVSKSGGPFGAPFLVPLDKSWGDPTVRYAPDGTLYIGSIC